MFVLCMKILEVVWIVYVIWFFFEFGCNLNYWYYLVFIWVEIYFYEFCSFLDCFVSLGWVLYFLFFCFYLIVEFLLFSELMFCIIMWVLKYGWLVVLIICMIWVIVWFGCICNVFLWCWLLWNDGISLLLIGSCCLNGKLIIWVNDWFWLRVVGCNWLWMFCNIVFLV